MKRLLILPLALILVGYVTSGCSSSNSDKPQNDSIAAAECESDNIVLTDSFIASVHQFDELYPFSEGFAVVRKDYKFGFINTKGELVIPCKYMIAGPFKEGLACVVVDVNDSKIAFINTEGEILQTKYPFLAHLYFGTMGDGYMYPELLSFQNGVCKIEYQNENVSDLQTVYIDKQLNEIEKPNEENTSMVENIQFEIFSESSKDIYGDDNELKGLKDKSGKVLIPAKYNNLLLSDNGVILATLFIEAADSHLHPYKPYGLRIDGYIDFKGNSTFTEADLGKLEGYKEAQLPIFNNLKLKEEEQARLEAEQEELYNNTYSKYVEPEYHDRTSAEHIKDTPSFRMSDDVYRYLSGKTFKGGTLSARIEYDGVYLNGTSVSAAPRISNVSPTTAVIKAYCAYLGGQDIVFYLDAQYGTLTLNSGEKLYLSK